jgi:uncharacterized protein (TIGR03382 family)
MTAGSGVPDRTLASGTALWALAAIVLVGAALRLPALDQVPPGPFCDEAAIATTAAALANTGRDLSGRPLPLYAEQRAFERWGEANIITQPLFQYFSVPFIVLGGLDLYSLRLAAAMLGLLAIPGTFLLANALFGRRVALVSAAAIAISPWHMHFSRVGFEAIAVPTVLAFSGWALLRGLSRPGFAFAGVTGLALCTYAYPAALVFAPLLLGIFALVHRRALRTQWRVAAACVLLLSLLELPNLVSMSQRGRVGELAISSAELDGERAVQSLEASDSRLAATLLEHRALLVPYVFAHNYASYLGPSFLFIRGDPNPRHGPTDSGVAHAFTAPLLLLGLAALLHRRREASAQLALGWLLAAPIAASLSTGGPHAIRSIVALPMLEIASALGAVTLFELAREASRGWPLRRIAATGLGALLAVAAPLEIARALRHYHRDYPVYSAPHWQAGVSAAIDAAEARRADYDRILVSGTIFDAYSFILFSGAIDYEALDPTRDLNAQLEPFGYRILFRDEHTELGDSHDLLLLSARDDVSKLEWRPVAEFPYPDGSPHLRLVEVGPER